jgi:XcyI-like restriction endonuclease
MELRGLINSKNVPDLDFFCTVMAENLSELVRQISPRITARDVSELPLLTLGAQLYGSNNNAIGKQATRELFFLSVKS